MQKYVPIGILLLWSVKAQAASDGFIFGYNLGVSYDATTRYAQIIYNAPVPGIIPPDCEPISSGSQRQMQCTAYLAPDTSDSSSFSLFLETPFRRQGFFYFEPGFTLSTISYTGVLNTKPSGPTGGATIGSTKKSKFEPTQPLTKAQINFYGLNLHSYLKIGLTPKYFPDLFVTGGLGIQIASGRIKVFTKDQNRAIAQPDAFGEFEIVPVIISQSGYISFYVGLDQSLSNSLGTNLIDDNPNGQPLTDFKLVLIGAASGVRLLIPF